MSLSDIAGSRAARALRQLFASGRPLVFVKTAEEERVAAILADMAPALGAATWSWSLTSGLRRFDDAGCVRDDRTAESALEFIAEFNEPAFFQLKDFHHAIQESAVVRRQLRDLYTACAGRNKFLVITSPLRHIPEELERVLAYIELGTPDLQELIGLIRQEAQAWSAPPAQEIMEQLAPALVGLTLEEARYALRRAAEAHGTLTEDSRAVLLEEKRSLFGQGGLLEFVSTPTTTDAIGGLQNLKQWLEERRKLFGMRDSLSREIVPKGVLIMGIPGCGKSLCVKAISSGFTLPLYRMNMVEVFSGRHGSPGTAFADACRRMEEIAPAVLWFDEIEMAVASSESSGEQGRIFAFFLTWMQEKAPGLFVAATANRIDLLPAEMVRKGRFDEVFFVDLPTDEERMEIFRIHLTKRGYDPKTLGIQELTTYTQGWTGAEVEQCVVSTITRATLAGRPPASQDLLTLAAKSVPLSRTMREQITHIRSWAFERATRATPQRVGK